MKRARVSKSPKAQEPGKNARTRVRKFFPGVKHVVDATEPLNIEVTKGDVSTSKRKAHSECAMAVACKRAKHLDGVIIATSTAYLIKGDTATRYTVPDSVGREVVAFDRGGSFEPGEYKLIKPNSPLGHGGSGSHAAAAYKRSVPHVTTNVRAVLGSDSVR